MLSCSVRFSAQSLKMGGGPESRCVGRVYCQDVAVRLATRESHGLRKVEILYNVTFTVPCIVILFLQ